MDTASFSGVTDFGGPVAVVLVHSRTWPGAMEMSNRAQMAAMMTVPSALAISYMCVLERERESR